ncbi:MAG: T9SS type A sorting domain-containing protein [Saprospiraceae bacterium]
MKSSLLLGLSLFLSFIGFAQNDDRIADTKTPLSEVEQIVLPLQDNKKLYDQEMAARRPGRAPAFAEAISVNITPSSHGHWEKLANGNELWRVRLKSLGAKSLNLGFTTFQLPTSASLILYTPDYETVRGPFTPADNEEHFQLWTPIMVGSEMVIELQVAPSKKSAVQLELTSVNHDFMGFIDPQSGSCNLDVICGAGDGWEVVEDYRDIIQSVSMYSLGGIRACTGFLVNNARQDCTPFYMTADHCGVTAGQAPSIVSYWNFESPTCRQPNTPASGNVNVGSLDVFNTGAVLRATAAATDFTLIEFDDPIVEEANAYFAGWDAKTYTPEGAVCIHHPGTDEKRISFEEDALQYGSQGGAVSSTGAYHRISDWDIGTTEGGSSGSPLFDPKTRMVIGQLFGGLAACGNSEYDVYGRFDLSYVGNGTPEASLQPWLDPDNTGLTEIEGRWARACNFFVQAEQSNFEFCQEGAAEYSLAVSENFAGMVTIVIDSTTIPTNAQLEFSMDMPMPGDTVSLTIPNITEIPAGDYTIVLTGTDGVDSVTTELGLSIFADVPTVVALVSPQDAAENVSLVTSFDWEDQGTGTTYDIEISTDSAFTNVDTDSGFGLTANSFASENLQAQTTYYWRVRAMNTCGENDWSPPISFETARVVCANFASANIPISISTGPPNTYTSTLEVLNNGEIVDMNVINLRGEHTWIADLGFTLTSPSGTTVTLVSPSCFDEDDFNLSLDDEASPNALPCPYNDGGTYQPAGSLADFNGENPQGTWTLTVTDGASQDGGELSGWGLDFCTALLGDFTLTSTTTEASICLSETLTFDLAIGTDFSAESFSLGAENLPAGATIEYSSTNPRPGDNLTVTISDFQTGTSGAYNILFTATDGEDIAFSQLELTLEETPTAATLTRPTNNATDVTTTTTLRFNDVDNTNGYLVEVATDVDFMNIVISEMVTDPSYSVSLELDTEYFWRVTTENDCGITTSEISTFRTFKDLAVVASPNTVAICQGEQAIFNISVGQSFLEAGATISSNNLPDDVTVTYSENPVSPGGSTEVVLDGLAGVAVGTYSITFIAADGENSNGVDVTIEVIATPMATTLTNPVDEAPLIAPNVTFEWQAVAGADVYFIEVATDAEFSDNSTVVTDNVNTTSFTVSDPLEMGTYFWRVTTGNDCGSAPSATFTFTVEASSTEDIVGFEFLLAPNPAQDWFSLNFNQAITERVNVQLFSVDGKSLFHQPLDRGTTEHRFNTTNLATGIYFLQLQTEEGVVNRKLIIQ